MKSRNINELVIISLILQTFIINGQEKLLIKVHPRNTYLFVIIQLSSHQVNPINYFY
jgi:hypothetical protein